MSDDDLDLDLDDEPVRPARTSAPRGPVGAPAAAAATPGAAPVAKPGAAPAPAAEAAAKSVSAVYRSLPQRLAHYVRHPRLSGRAFLTLLIVLLVIVLIAENSAPERFYLLGLSLELPKSLAFVIDAALGALLMWLWLRRQGGAAESGK